MIRKAAIGDVKEIHTLLSVYAKTGVLLPRSLSELYESLRDYLVYISNESGRVLGTCALQICWEDLAEIRSLAVKEGHEKRRIGSSLVEACITEAISLGLKKIFVLTYIPDFFKRFGFKTIDKDLLPHKIWADCIRCVKFPECGEIAMMLEPQIK